MSQGRLLPALGDRKRRTYERRKAKKIRF